MVMTPIAIAESFPSARTSTPSPLAKPGLSNPDASCSIPSGGMILWLGFVNPGHMMLAPPKMNGIAPLSTVTLVKFNVGYRFTIRSVGKIGPSRCWKIPVHQRSLLLCHPHRRAVSADSITSCAIRPCIARAEVSLAGARPIPRRLCEDCPLLIVLWSHAGPTPSPVTTSILPTVRRFWTYLWFGLIYLCLWRWYSFEVVCNISHSCLG